MDEAMPLESWVRRVRTVALLSLACHDPRKCISVEGTPAEHLHFLNKFEKVSPPPPTQNRLRQNKTCPSLHLQRIRIAHDHLCDCIKATNTAQMVVGTTNQWLALKKLSFFEFAHSLWLLARSIVWH